MNYKIINRDSQNVHFLNSEQSRIFLANKRVKNYKVINLTELQRIRKNKILDVIAIFCTLAAFLLLTVIYIQTNY